MNTPIPYTKPSITDYEIELVNDAVTNGWGHRCYDYIRDFEREFAFKLGAKYAVATSSCTGALHLGLAAAGIGYGDEVIIGDCNWIASVAPVCHLGAKPIFVDILPDTWCIDPKRVKEAITEKTKAIIAVHLYGNPCGLNELRSIADEYGLLLVEDSAEALGTKISDVFAGTFGDFGVFSFHGTKTLTTGEGGMLITDNELLHNQVRTLNSHGRRLGQKKQFWPEVIGYKFQISNLQAAIGCAQIRRMNELVNRKIEIFEYYKDKLKSELAVQMNPRPQGTINSYWMPTVVFDSLLHISNDEIIDRFRRSDIDARIFFQPLSSLPMFEKDFKGDNPVSYDISKRAVNLPSFHDITDEQIDAVVAVVRSLVSSR